MESLKIWSLCVTAAILYGIVHAQITARLAVEYFTIGHVSPPGLVSHTLLGLYWGSF